MAAVGLKTQIWANNTRSAILLAGFPVLLVMILFGLQLVLMGFGFLPSSGRGLDQDLVTAGSMLWATIPLALIVAGIWFAIAYVGNQTMIDVMTGARRVERKDEPALYNLLENLAISRGMKTPTLRIVETDSLNAFASGLHEGRYSVTVTRGLMQALTPAEMQAVLAHEMTHIINKDVRTMVIATIFAGIISVIAQILFRGLFYVRGGGGGKNKNAGPLILIGLAIAGIGAFLAVVIRLMLSRSREYVADAGSVELTKDPDAMISALRKVSGHSAMKAPDEVQGMFLDNQPDGSGVDALFATHPSIENRIKALVKYAGGLDLGAFPETPATAADAHAAPVSGGSAVPATGYSTSVPTGG